MEKVYIYYKVDASTERGQAIAKFEKDAKESAQRTSEVAKELGTVSYTESPNAVYPGVGIGSLIFNRPQSQRAYKRIGRKKGLYECIPVNYTSQGKEIIRKILSIRPVNSRYLREAFAVPDSAEVAPVWYELDGAYYLRCAAYSLSSEYSIISQAEFEEGMRRVKEREAAKE